MKTWVFQNSGASNIDAGKINTFELDSTLGSIGEMPQHAFTFRAEIPTDAWRFLGEAANDDSSLIFVSFVHSESSLFSSITNILVAPSGLHDHPVGGLTATVALAELRRLMERVPDGHVMCETVAPASMYTGERVSVDWAADRDVLKQYAEEVLYS
jgi:hypothetical protein